MKTQKEINEIRKTLMNGKCTFIIKGLKNYLKTKKGNYEDILQTLKINENATYIYEENYIGNREQMNIQKFTKNTIHLYTYSMLNDRVKGKINLQDVTIIEVL